MSASSPHRVRTQRWQLRAHSLAEAHALRSAALGAQAALDAALARAFDARAPGEAFLHVPRLELHVRVRTPDELAVQLPLALAEALDSQLREERTTAHTPRREPSAATHAPAPAREVSAAHALAQLLAHGELPWFAEAGEPGATRERLARAARETPELLARVLGASAPAEAALAAAFRWLSLHPEAEWPRVFAEQTRARAGEPRNLALREILAELRVDARVRRLLAAALLVLAQREQLTPERAAALLRWLEREATGERAADLPAALVHWLTEARALEVVTDTRGQRDEQSASTSGAPAQPQDAQAPGISPLREAKSSAREAEAPRERVAHAGVLLLHPFLPRLFAALGLDSGEGFRGETLSRALAALHFLATGAEDPLEHELTFAKLLLGAQRAPAFVAPGVLSARDREECDALLAAAIGHWSVLKRSSPAALREGFLQRAALLRESDEAFELWFESRGIDVLLAQLPWGISFVKLPWLAKPIVTQWSAP